MPVTVIVRAGHGKADGAPSLTFDGTRVVIGRGDGCEVRLPDPSVSHRHATIRVSGTDHTLVDEGSVNGTFVGGVRLSPNTPRLLKSGDEVRVGRVWLEVKIDQRPATPNLASATRELALALVARAMESLDHDTSAKVHVVEGADLGAVLRLEEEGRAYVVGRGETCDLPLADEDASREHLTLVRRGGVVLLRDLGSKNGVMHGEAQIPPSRDVAWRPHLVVRVGRTVLALEEPVTDALASLEAIPDEAMPEEEVPPPPPSAAAPPSAKAVSADPSPLSAAASSAGAQAPIAQVATVSTPPAPPKPKAKKRAWSAADAAVVAAAVLVITLSVIGLFVLLRGS